MTLHHASRRRLLAFAAALSLAGGLALPLHAQPTAWPTKPIKLVVGYAAGGATDVIARIIALKLGEQLGQPMVVDNRAGANSNVGAEVVAKSVPDGYTLYVYTIANTINASLYDKLGYDPQKDFEPIGLIARIPNILVVNPKLPVKTLADYIRFAKASQDGITFASSGSGSSIHLSGEMFKMQARLNMLHIPYRGSAPAVTDLLGGQVQSMFDNTPSALPHVKAGRLRAIAITSAQRSPLLPEVPTVAESGFPGFDVQSWFSLAAPAGTPRPVIERLNSALNKVLAAPDVRQRLQDLAATPEPGSPEQLRRLIAAETKRWHDVVKQSGAKAE
ncbi:tripartite tricarboxylate transporter substrate binding protein [Cupriavidus basilensis]|uniref:Tripartite tricarboxylate transporter substrate binding protein n=1 Tax=Cupriavidus basilensis TaxID=68895 RepID=A0A643FVU6_9BURK|nr:tripartite tricarboxylate transporter substrate binding protein [Cupriavidus basilensis]MCP3017644.1 tripartite tricarboxylate transporter substrate binding protein [Cupriavidus basilensis]MDR3381420.1 tripartite tricarboxylate transporter substrate binding protein [Cupriavidus basilensis]QOT77977.1 tripartite tricarboxylate transporter substrate binding protein [Cupriavidus basilensis]